MKRITLVIALMLSNINFFAQENHFEWNGATPVFPNEKENQVTYINFGDAKLWGYIEVTLTGGYNYRLTTGKYTKRFQIGKNPAAGHFSQATEVPTNFGPVGSEWKIGEFEFVNGNLRIPIYHLLTTKNALKVSVEGVSVSVYDTQNITISPVTTLVNNESRDYVSINGKVGIGTKTPFQKLDVNGHVKFDAIASNHTNLQIGHDSNDRIFADNSPAKSYGGGMFFRIHNEDVSAKYVDAMMITEKGDIGIGTKDTKGFKLGVNGKIAATEVKVATYTNWPDYVFKKEYNLRTLNQVENQIKEKGHLEGIPNAAEVKKNGFFLGKMNAKLLQKIEELTLYAIEQEKEIEKLKTQKSLVEEIKKENKILKQRLIRLEELVNKLSER